MAATAATAAGAAVLLYFVVSRKLCCCKGEVEDDDLLKSRGGRRKRRVVVQAAPATWQESISTLSETLRFMYSETLAKWPLGDLAFGINYFMRRQGNLQVASVYAGTNSVQLKGPEIIVELNSLLRLLTFCIFFSKKPFPVFLESAGYSQSDVLLQKPKAGLLKPAFTILCDKSFKCFLLLIRGTHSIKDTLTAAAGAVVPFHHSVLHDGGISNLVLGYAHCGMVAAARWISKLSIPVLLKALNEYPDYKVKVVGHSLGGGTAALLTYILREQIELSSSICITFAPAACMTWDLAESGKHFITTVINNSDLVPTFSASSVDNLRSEVRASSWLNDMRDQVEHTRGLNVVYRSATSLSSSIASTKARVIGAGSLLQPVSSSTKVMMKRAQSGAQNVAQVVVRTRSSIIMVLQGARRRVVAPISKSEVDTLETAPLVPDRAPETLVAEVILNKPAMEDLGCDPSCGGTEQDDPDEEGRVSQVDRVVSSSAEGDDITEGELWLEIDRELRRHEHETSINSRTDEEEEAVVKEITEEENLLVDATERANMITSDTPENRHFYPPGRIMHIISIPSSDTNNQVTDVPPPTEERICIYETPRNLYSKLRLTKTMINDHYMPMYKRKMELLIKELEKEELQSCELSQVCV